MKSLFFLPLGLLSALFVSCETLPLSERQFISQPSMLFEGTGAHKFDCGLTSQIETGRVGAGGASGGGCSSCH